MNYIHRLVFRPDGDIAGLLKDYGFDYTVSPSEMFVVLEIDEDDDRWCLLKPELSKFEVTNDISTVFSLDELRNARWLRLASERYRGYPMPMDGFKYRTKSFNMSQFCEWCGLGLIQNNDFCIKGEVKWGKRSIMQLNWVYDEFFVKPEFYQQALEPLGIKCRSVRNIKSGKELDSIVQIVIDQEIEVDMDGYKDNFCHACGRCRYEHIFRGPFPHVTKNWDVHIAKTNVAFGNNAASHSLVLVSQDFYTKLIDAGCKEVFGEPWRVR